MSLFKTKDVLKPFFPNIIADVLEGVLPFCDTAAEEYIIPAIGRTFYDALDTAYNSNTPLSEANQALLPKIQKPIAYFAFQYWFIHGQTQKSNRGVSIVSTESMKTAWKWQIDDEKEGCRHIGYQHLEVLLKFLDDNLDNYTAYSESDEYEHNHEHLINFASDFNKYYFIENSRDTFETIRPIMREIESLQVKETLGIAYYNELKGKIIEDNTNEADIIILDDLKHGVARLTIAQALLNNSIFINKFGVVQRSRTSSYTDGGLEMTAASEAQKGPLYESLVNKGNTFLAKVSEYLNSKASESLYATYFTDTTVYVSPTAESTAWNNTTPGTDGLAKRIFVI